MSNYSFPPGKLGELAQHFYDNAYKQVEASALATAIGLVAGIAGRAFCVDRMGLNLYVMLLAGTGRGKNILRDAPHTLARELTAMIAKYDPTTIYGSVSDFVGGVAVSGSALHRDVAERQSLVVFNDEFQDELRVIMGKPRDEESAKKQSAYLTLFTSSGPGKIMPMRVYAKAENNTKPLESPAFSFVGASTPESFYALIDETSRTSGFIPRLLTLEHVGDIPYSNPDAGSVGIDPDLAQWLCRLTKFCKTKGVNEHGEYKPFAIEMTDGAREAFELWDRQLIDAQNRRKDSTFEHVMSRVIEKSKRLAALIALGIESDTVISESIAEWAYHFCLTDAHRIYSKIVNGQTGGGETDPARQEKIESAIVKWLRMEPGEVAHKFPNRVNWPYLRNAMFIPRAFIQMNVTNRDGFANTKQGEYSTLDRILMSMERNGEIKRPTSGARPKNGEDKEIGGEIYQVCDIEVFRDTVARINRSQSN